MQTTSHLQLLCLKVTIREGKALYQPLSAVWKPTEIAKLDDYKTFPTDPP